MNRRFWMKFLPAALLPVLAKGQDWNRCVDKKMNGGDLSVRLDPDFGYPRDQPDLLPAKNNQCPVCGTMAAAYANPDKGALSCIGMGGPVACGPASRVTRCLRFNAAFWQDAA